MKDSAAAETAVASGVLGQSVVEAIDRFLRAFLDYVFLRPKRFWRRYELRRTRYPRPAAFLVETLTVVSIGLWALDVVFPQRDTLPDIRPTAASQGLFLFGQSIALMLPCWLALRSMRRRVRLRRLFAAVCYASAPLVFLPFLYAALYAMQEPTFQTGTAIPGAWMFWGVTAAFNLVNVLYIASAVAASHHVSLSKLWLAGGAWLALPTVLFLLRGPYDRFTEWWSDAVEWSPSHLETSTLASAPVLVNCDSVSPQAASWWPMARVKADTHVVNFRILYFAQSATAENVRVHLSTLAREHDVTIFRAAITADNAASSVGYAELINPERKRLVYVGTELFGWGTHRAARFKYKQTGAEVLTGDGLRLGNVPTSHWGHVVVKYRLE